MQVSVFVVVSLQLLVCHELQSSVRRPEQAGNKPLGTEKSRFSHGEIKTKQNSDLLIFNTPDELGKLFFTVSGQGFFFPPWSVSATWWSVMEVQLKPTQGNSEFYLK